MTEAGPPFIVYALPRSRTYWLSRFLSTEGWHCGHDEIRHVRSLEDVKSWLAQPFTGTVETAAAPFWRLVETYCPDIRTVVVRRPVADVVESAIRLGVGIDRAKLTKGMTLLDHKLDQIEARARNVISVRFSELGDYSQSGLACGRVFQHCLGQRMNTRYWIEKDKENLQIDMLQCLRYFQAFKPQMDKAASIAKHKMLRDMARHAPVEKDGVTFQQEDFDTFFRDSESLMREHCAQIGERPDSFRSKNVPLARRLYEKGVMQITTARCNGRMFGYLMTLYGPSMESETETEALNLAFFASPDIPLLGLRLKQACAAALREKGVNRVFSRTGRAGPRMGVLDRRMGAEEIGIMYKLELEAE